MYRLKYDEKTLLEMPYWILQYRLKQLEELDKAQKEELKKHEAELKSKMPSLPKYKLNK